MSHGFLVGVRRQLQQQAEELGIPPANHTSPDYHTSLVEDTRTVDDTFGATDECLQLGTIRSTNMYIHARVPAGFLHWVQTWDHSSNIFSVTCG